MPAIIDTVLTLALALIMFSLGLSLALKDFRQVVTHPKAFTVGVIGQVLMLPLIATAIIFALQPPQTVALGLLILAIAPGGATSAFMTSLFRGNVALSISLTAVCGLLVIFTTPVLLALLLPLIAGNAFQLQVPLLEVFQSLIRIVAGPVMLGMLVRGFWPGLTAHIEKPIKIVAAVLFFLLLIGAIVSQIDLVQSYLVVAGVFTILLNVAALLVAFLLAVICRLTIRDGIAIIFECGMQNAPLAMFVAISVLNQEALSIAPAIYGVLQAPITLAIGAFIHRYLYPRTAVDIG